MQTPNSKLFYVFSRFIFLRFLLQTGPCTLLLYFELTNKDSPPFYILTFALLFYELEAHNWNVMGDK